MQQPKTQKRLRHAAKRKFANGKVQKKISRAVRRRWTDPEFREKMRQVYMRPEIRQQWSERASKQMNSPQMKEKLRQLRLQRTFPQKMTAIEETLYREFKKRRLRFEMHKTMFGRFQPDFVFEQARLIVQADGDYWHSLPKRRASDHAFAKAALAEGWSVWRFGEREIQMHTPACARAVARFVRDHQT